MFIIVHKYSINLENPHIVISKTPPVVSKVEFLKLKAKYFTNSQYVGNNGYKINYLWYLITF